jgi:hypothetical protein
MTVSRRPLQDENQDGCPRQQRDAPDIFIDVGLVDNLAEDPGRACGRARRNPHQQEGDQVSAPVGCPLLGDQAANQNRGARGIVSNFRGKFGHPRSIDGDRANSPRVRQLRDASLPAMSRFFKSNQDLRPTRI